MLDSGRRFDALYLMAWSNPQGVQSKYCKIAQSL